MKIKFLAIIASLFILPFAVTSCLNSNNEYEPGTDDTISAFELDTIYGKSYKFTIDQIRGEIYNQDSVPFSSDTIINKILIKKLSHSGWVVTGDTLFNQTDSVDFSKTSSDNPLTFKVYAQAGGDPKEYKIWVNRHQIDPDSLVWGTRAYVSDFSGGTISTEQETKMVLLDSDVLLYTTNGTTTTFYSKEKQWQPAVTVGLDKPILSSIVNFNDTLYVVHKEDGTVRRSIDGTNWEPATYHTLPENISSTTFKVKTIITTFRGTKNKDADQALACIIEDESGTSFATATVNASGKLVWTKGEKVPSDFPFVGKLSATKSFTTDTGGQQAILIGTPSTGDVTIPWFAEDGLNWAPLEVIEKHALPKWNEPTILYYGNTLYAFGGAYDTTSGNDFSTVYTPIDDGFFAWKEIIRGFLFPNENGESKFKGEKGCSIIVDKDNYIWVSWSTTREIWRGRLNRLIN